jgi:AraC family transcriptional regulator of adaptative response/methylated-DNA-[protein]-cysteine methyltransferase
MLMSETIEQARLDEERCWEAVLARDSQVDGTFVFAVHSTGIYCRPSCPARRPRRENVSFFQRAEEAASAGFRPCRRCQPEQTVLPDPQAELVAQICQYIAEHFDESLRLVDLSEHFHLSPYHLQRTFKRVTGVSPRQYAESCRLRQFKARLQDGEGVTDALYNAGYQSSSRVYERVPDQLGMTPSSYRRGGEGIRLMYAIAETSLGFVLMAATERGVAAVILGDSASILVQELAREYPMAELVHNDEELRPWMTVLLQLVQGQCVTTSVPLDVQASAFQWRVWEALRAIPMGETRSYQEVARSIGHPTAIRAVAHACASNSVAVFIPCHRVVRSNGHLAGYRWGIERKQQLLDAEQAVLPTNQQR